MESIKEKLRKLKIGDSLVFASYTRQDLERASKILEMKEGDDFEKAYKKMAMKHHPDRGGSENQMKDVNWAKDVFEYFGEKTAPKARPDYKQWAEEKEKEMKANEKRLHDFLGELKKHEKDYEDYFASYFKVTPSEYLKEFVNDSYGEQKIVWDSENKDARFLLNVLVRPDVSTTLKLAGDDSRDYTISYTTYVWLKGKEYKMSQKTYKSNAALSALKTPSLIFPKDKLDKAIAGTTRKTYAKRDFLGALKIQLDADIWNALKTEFASIPINDTEKLTIFRTSGGNGSSFYRKFKKANAMWMPNGIYEKGKKTHQLKMISWEETPEGLEELKKYLHAIKSANSDYSKFK